MASGGGKIIAWAIKWAHVKSYLDFHTKTICQTQKTALLRCSASLRKIMVRRVEMALPIWKSKGQERAESSTFSMNDGEASRQLTRTPNTTFAKHCHLNDLFRIENDNTKLDGKISVDHGRCENKSTAGVPYWKYWKAFRTAYKWMQCAARLCQQWLEIFGFKGCSKVQFNDKEIYSPKRVQQQLCTALTDSTITSSSTKDITENQK